LVISALATQIPSIQPDIRKLATNALGNLARGTDISEVKIYFISYFFFKKKQKK